MSIHNIEWSALTPSPRYVPDVSEFASAFKPLYAELEFEQPGVSVSAAVRKAEAFEEARALSAPHLRKHRHHLGRILPRQVAQRSGGHHAQQPQRDAAQDRADRLRGAPNHGRQRDASDRARKGARLGRQPLPALLFLPAVWAQLRGCAVARNRDCRPDLRLDPRHRKQPRLRTRSAGPPTRPLSRSP